jgi:hypothetical protein
MTNCIDCDVRKKYSVFARPSTLAMAKAEATQSGTWGKTTDLD